MPCHHQRKKLRATTCSLEMTKLHYLHSASLDLKKEKKKSFNVSIEVIWCFSESKIKFTYRGFLKKEIQPSSHKERHPKTQKQKVKVCEITLSAWQSTLNEAEGLILSNITESSYHPPTQTTAATGRTMFGTLINPSVCWEWTLNWLNRGTEAINVAACLTTGSVGEF